MCDTQCSRPNKTFYLQICVSVLRYDGFIVARNAVSTIIIQFNVTQHTTKTSYEQCTFNARSHSFGLYFVLRKMSSRSLFAICVYIYLHRNISCARMQFSHFDRNAFDWDFIILGSSSKFLRFCIINSRLIANYFCIFLHNFSCERNDFIA